MKAVPKLAAAVAIIAGIQINLAQSPATNAPRPHAAPPAGTISTSAGTNAMAHPVRNRLPFQGAVKAVDTTAKTITLAGPRDQDRVLQLDGETRLIKAAKPATLAEVQTNDFARGLLKKNERGEEVLVHGTFGPKPAPKPKTPVRQTKPAGPRGTNAPTAVRPTANQTPQATKQIAPAQ